MSVPRFLTEEGRCVVFGPHANESIIAAKAPATVRRVPLEAAANVARQERFGVGHAETGLLEHRETSDSAGDVWHHRRPGWRRHHEVAGVVQLIGPLLIAREPAKLKILRNAQRPSDFALNPDDPIDVVREGGAKVVIAEARPLGSACIEGPPAWNDGDFDRAGSSRRLLRERATRSDDRQPGDQNCDPTFHDCLLEP